MIKVNLLSGATGAAPSREWLPREQRSALLGLGMLVLTGLGVAGWWYYLHTERQTLETQIASSEAELLRLKNAAALVEKTTARKTELSERLSLIDRLRGAKREPVNLLEAVSRAIPDGLWLLEMKQSGVSVQIDGRAMSLTGLTDFAQRMQNSGLFKHPVEILTTATEIVENSEIVRFSIKADAAAPAGTVSDTAIAPVRGSGI
jgi:type IV pilus assembly protein PilN